MQRYFLDESASDAPLALPKDVAHHLVKVLRATVGTQVEVVLNDHKAYVAEVATVEPEATVKLVKQLDHDSELPVDVTLLCGLPKTKEKPELIVQKATELGANEIAFFESVRSVSHWDDKKRGKKLERLQKIADGAAEQSHRNRQPKVTYYPDLKTALDQINVDMGLVAWEESAKQGEQSALAQSLNKFQQGDRVMAIFGPEGGLTEEEIAQMEASDIVAVGLGPRILRTETAPLYFMSALSYALELSL